MPKLRKRGGTWHYSFTVGGERVRRSAKTPDREIAEAAALEHERRLRRAAVFGVKAELSFAEAVNHYLDHKSDARFLLALLDHFGKAKVAAIDQPAVRRAARALYPKASPATWNRQVVTPVRAVINFCAEDGLCDHFRMRRFAEGPGRKRRAGDKAWLAAFQAQAGKDGLPRLAALARFMFETGARVGQSCALQWSDVDLTEGLAILRTRKTGPNGPEMAERVAFLTRAMVAELANLTDRHPRLVFGYSSRSTVAKSWNAVRDRAKIAPLGRHEAGRHGFGTEMIVRAGIDVATAADLGGWKSRRLLVERYAHGREEREVIDRVFGKEPRKSGA